MRELLKEESPEMVYWQDTERWFDLQGLPNITIESAMRFKEKTLEKGRHNLYLIWDNEESKLKKQNRIFRKVLDSQNPIRSVNRTKTDQKEVIPFWRDKTYKSQGKS